MSPNQFIGRYAALLLSRQHLRPCRHTSWVSAARDAVAWVHTLGFGVTSSVGMQTWELVTTLARDQGMALKLIIPAHSMDDFESRCAEIAEQFDLSASQVSFVSAVGGEAKTPSHRLQACRDRLVVENADLLLPLSIRQHGNMARLIAEAEASGKVVEHRFDCGPPEPGKSAKVTVAADALSPEIDLLGGDYVIHWTRAANSAWPGQRLVDFHRSLLRADSWPHTGFAALKRILGESRLRASSDNMPGKVATVSFSDLPPRDVVPLMTWRARYNRMAFEPYGVCIHNRVAKWLGILPVMYYDSAKKDAPAKADVWRSQSIGKITDWRGEREYRCLGDIDLSTICDSDIAIICRTPGEAKVLRNTTSYRIVAMQLCS